MRANKFHCVFRDFGKIPLHILEDECIIMLIKRDFCARKNLYTFTRLHCRDFYLACDSFEDTLEVDHIIAFVNLSEEDQVFLKLAGVRLRQVSHIPIEDIYQLNYYKSLVVPREEF